MEILGLGRRSTPSLRPGPPLGSQCPLRSSLDDESADATGAMAPPEPKRAMAAPSTPAGHSTGVLSALTFGGAEIVPTFPEGTNRPLAAPGALGS
jgi:hypothetical protein